MRYYSPSQVTKISNDFFGRRTILGGTPDNIPGTLPKPPTIQEILDSELLHGPSPKEDPECHAAILHSQRNEISRGVGENYQACAMMFYAYMSHLYLLTVSPQLKGHVHLSGKHGANIEKSLISQVNGAASMLLHKLAIAGWMSREGANYTTLRSYTQRGDDEREIYYMFILPCVVKLVHTMNPHNFFSIKTILDMNIGSWEHSLKKKANSFGVWDRLLVEGMAGRNEIKSSDNNMCKGVRFEVAHFLSCTMVGFADRWNKVISLPLLSEGQMDMMDLPLAPFIVTNRVAGEGN
jgi:hypothetical protein